MIKATAVGTLQVHGVTRARRRGSHRLHLRHPSHALRSLPLKHVGCDDTWPESEYTGIIRIDGHMNPVVLRCRERFEASKILQRRNSGLAALRTLSEGVIDAKKMRITMNDDDGLS